MPVKSTTRYAVLGLLAIKPMSAYELVKFSNETIGFFWNESYGNIHRMLRKLEYENMIFLIQDLPSGRRKKTYTTTEKGHQQLKAWLQKPPEEIILRDELLLKLFMSEQEDITQMCMILQQELEEMTKGLAILNEVHREIEGMDQDQTRKAFWLLTLNYGKSYAKTRQTWCQEAIDQLNQIERTKFT